MKFKSAKLLYSLDKKDVNVKKDLHKSIDGKPNLLLVAQTEQGKIVGAFCQKGININCK
jgi:hypothetical protein